MPVSYIKNNKTKEMYINSDASNTRRRSNLPFLSSSLSLLSPASTSSSTRIPPLLTPEPSLNLGSYTPHRFSNFSRRKSLRENKTFDI